MGTETQTKSPLASKMVWANTLGMASVVLADASGWLEKADPSTLTAGAIVWGVVNIILRVVTKSSLAFPKK